MKTLLKVLISIILITIVLVVIGPQEIILTAGQIPLWAVVASFFFILLAILNFSFRVYTLAIALNRIPFRDVLNKATLALCLGTFSPAKLGELMLIQSLNKHKISFGAATALFLVDRLNSLLSIAVFAVLGVLLVAPLEQNIPIVIGGGLALVLGSLVLLSKTGLRIIKKIVYKKITEKFMGFSKAILKFKRNGSLFINLGLNAFHLLVRTLSVHVLLVSLHVDVPFFLLLSVNAIVTVAAFLPISFSGLGVREGGAVVIFAAFGFASEPIAAAFLTVSLFTYALAAVLLPFVAQKPFKS